ncbi:21606_t:CDS:1 [Dentiscutata erythropus]|uniref:21606_t:CDS:1 n=1 Tax=Dentiscutata erythropus TaxID=1348616 RepID=A0A9N9F828_9GLOM|nr:21606_t:CDS:1 [Dentiscutata erythropus]
MTTTNTTQSNFTRSKMTKDVGSMVNSNSRFSRFAIELNDKKESIIESFTNRACCQYESRKEEGREYLGRAGQQIYPTYDPSQPSPSSRSNPIILRGINIYSSLHYYLHQLYKIWRPLFNEF